MLNGVSSTRILMNTLLFFIVVFILEFLVDLLHLGPVTIIYLLPYVVTLVEKPEQIYCKHEGCVVFIYFLVCLFCFSNQNIPRQLENHKQ